jgi:ABC-type transport system involved in multi-copper enzyme maturation permease subunit
MFKILFSKEIAENIHNYRFLLAFVLCLVIIPLGFTVSQKEYTDRRQVYDETVRDYEQTRATMIDLMRNGGAAFRPPSSLGFLSGGVEMVLPSSVETRGYISEEGTEVTFNNTRRLDMPFTSLFGRLDLTFIVTTVMAVLVMIFTFNAVAGEKERRTLAQIMANSVPRPMVITAKMAAVSSLLAAAFLAGTAAGILLSMALGLNPFAQPGTLALFAIGIGASLVFLLALDNLGLLISGLSRTSVSAMVALLSAWVALAMILPKGSVVAAKFLLPVKSQQVVDLEKNQVRLQLQRELYAELDKLTKSTPGIKDMSMDEYFEQSRAKNPAIEAFEKSQNTVKDGFKARTNAALEKIDAEFERQRRAQAALARNISRLSPVSCLVHVMAELAGTGFVEESRWRETRSRFKQMLDRDIASKQRAYTFKDITYSGRSKDIDYKAPAPKLPAEPVPLEKRLAAVWVDLALLVIYGLLFFAAAYVKFLRYDVR